MSNERSRPPRDRDPWCAPVLVAQIPSTGLHKIIEPSAQEAMALTAVGGLLHATGIRAEFTLMPQRGDHIRVEGRVTGRVGQTCVVSLDPLDNSVDETVELLFAPADQIRTLETTIDEPHDDDEDRPDPPEPIENGIIDLGRIASDALYLGLDPYPRKPDAKFQAPVVEDDPNGHPFAALKVLKPKS